LADWIISHFPYHRIYTEAFGGAASVLIQKPPSFGEVYNDLDNEVVNLFRVLQDKEKADELLRLLRLTPWAREEFKEAYRPTEDPVRRAWGLVVMSFMGFGSNSHARIATGFRTCSNRSGTIPAQAWQNYPTGLEAVVDRFRGVVIENRPAVEVLRQHDQADALHYVDPPYVHSTRSDVRADYAVEMSDQDHAELLEVLRDLKGMVVLSGYASTLYDQALGNWKRIEHAALSDGARKRTEVLWLNPAAAGKQVQMEIQLGK
jgi:DNA adenine methylase